MQKLHIVARSIAIFGAFALTSCSLVEPPIHRGTLAGSAETEQYYGPVLTIAEDTPAESATALQQIADETLQVMTSNRFLENAIAMSGQYPELFINGKLGYRSAAWTASNFQDPVGDYRFNATPITLGEKRAFTGYDRLGWRMQVPQETLTLWESEDVVERSCAIRIIAHETSHTLVDMDGSIVMVDDGADAFSSRRTGTTGSYVMAGLAQCTWLQNQGRIGEKEVPACVAEFYKAPVFPWERGQFADNKCDEFPGDTPIGKVGP
ncbi:MAG: hypothetical protein AAGH53_12290 [Pseudomonadota bacterium]